MAIIKRSLGNNRQIIIAYFRKTWTDGLGGLAFKAFCDGWKFAWEECINQSPKLRNERIAELEAEIKILKETRKCSCGKSIYFYTYCDRCRKDWAS